MWAALSRHACKSRSPLRIRLTRRRRGGRGRSPGKAVVGVLIADGRRAAPALVLLLLCCCCLLLCDPSSSYWASPLRRCVVVDVTREDVWPTSPCRRAAVICDRPLTAGGLGVMSIDVVPPGCTDQKSLAEFLLFWRAEAHKHWPLCATAPSSCVFV